MYAGAFESKSSLYIYGIYCGYERRGRINTVEQRKFSATKRIFLYSYHYRLEQE